MQCARRHFCICTNEMIWKRKRAATWAATVPHHRPKWREREIERLGHTHMWWYKVSTEHRLATVNRPSMTKHLNYPACVVHNVLILNALCNGFELFNSWFSSSFFFISHFISMFILRVQFDFFFACTRSTKCKNPTENREKQKKNLYMHLYIQWWCSRCSHSML